MGEVQKKFMINEKVKNKKTQDHAPLIEVIHKITGNTTRRFIEYPLDDGIEADRFNLRSPHGVKKPVIVTAEDTALEIGSPHHRAVNTLLWTHREGVIRNRVLIGGIEMEEAMPGPVTAAVCSMTEIEESLDTSGPNFQALRHLSNMLPGYMIRSMPGKMWVRLHHDLAKAGFSSYSLAQCLAHAYRQLHPAISAVEVVVVMGIPDIVEEMESVDLRARIINGTNRNISLEEDGSLVCEDLDCTHCENVASCDIIREIIKKKRGDNGKNHRLHG